MLLTLELSWGSQERSQAKKHTNNEPIGSQDYNYPPIGYQQIVWKFLEMTKLYQWNGELQQQFQCQDGEQNRHRYLFYHVLYYTLLIITTGRVQRLLIFE